VRPRLPRLCAAYPCAPARFPAALRALAEAVAWVRAGAAENHVDPRQISVCGFSAGGHLAGSLGVFWNAPFLAAETGLAPQDMRPDKMVLCYPVITGGEFAHKGSFDNLLGADADAARRAEVSLEQHVTQDTPPAFLWHTYTDPGVPVENTMLFAMALRPCGRTV
jgi:acetyl esterase/lipase